MKRSFFLLLPIIALMALLSLFDLPLSRYFYENGFSEKPVYFFIYKWGIIPGWILFFWGAFLLILSSISKKWIKWRPHALLIVLTLIVGSGLIVHGVFKDHWGRPRPKQIIEFGGEQPYRPFYLPNLHPPEPSKSFACGHCTMGFYFFALAIVAKRLHRRKLQIGAFLFALALGAVISLARIAQGGHFLSDTLFAALIIWLTAAGLEWLIYPPPLREE